ncbi:MAG: RNA polymerase sigma factor [Thermoanaerobaculia bacterium]|nr:RNA polymerase sigma factor [Thermoanaerobaculia bacterium]
MTSEAGESLVGAPETEDRAPDGSRESEGALATAMERAAGGNREALAEIYDLLADDLYNLALWRCGSAADAADAVQDVFVELARRGARLRSIRKPRSYLLKMVHRAAVKRAKGRSAEAPLEDALLVPSTTPDPRRRAEARLCNRWLARLPREQREVVLLRCFQGMTFAEIGEVTGVPKFTAASRYRLGIARLRRWMRTRGDDR